MVLPKRLVVVAAHPDDDTIGCGGTMALVARAGGAVRTVYLSDGSRSHPGSSRFPAARVATLRAAEARAALAILGVTCEPLFFALTDGTLGALTRADRDETVSRLARDIDAFDADALFAPWCRDPHPDHIAAANLAADALSRIGRAPVLYWYEVWLSVRGSPGDRPLPNEVTTHTIGLDADIRARKHRALLAHATQTTDLIDDDPGGFRIDAALVAHWTQASENLHAAGEQGRYVR